MSNVPLHLRSRPMVYAPSTAMVWNIDHFAALTGLLDERYTRACCQALRQAMVEFGPDVVVDSWNLCACLAAKILGTPLVTVIHNCIHPLSRGFIWWKEPPASVPTPLAIVNKILTEHNLPTVRRVAELYNGDLTLVQGTPQTDPLPPEANVSYIGAVLWQKPGTTLPEWVERLDRTRPVIWVYTGNPQYGPLPSWADSAVVLRACIAALADEAVQVIVTTGFHSLPKDVSRLPQNFFVAPYLPGLALAARSDLLIHPGGYYSCQTGLVVGTPSLIIPTFSEREGNARRIAELGAGEFVLPITDAPEDKRVPAEQIWLLTQQMLTTPAYALHARQAGQQLRACGGPDKAARMLETFAARGVKHPSR